MFSCLLAKIIKVSISLKFPAIQYSSSTDGLFKKNSDCLIMDGAALKVECKKVCEPS